MTVPSKANRPMDDGGVLLGRAALITGAAGGIGWASAKRFAEAGAALVLVDRDERVEALAAEINAAGGRAIAVVADSGTEAVMEAACRRCVDEFGRLDACFANAGVGGTLRRLLDQDLAEWNEVLRVNLIGTFLAVKHAAAIMKRQGSGAIICTASVAGIRSGAAASPYSAAKAGVISLVQLAANDLAGTGVRVNAICPGLIETAMTQPIFEGAKARGTEDLIGQLNPTRRPGQPDEIAKVAVFLASDGASYINGQAIAVDGGLTSSLPTVPPRPKPKPSAAG
jgi:NAD(P)-dependent dehydrogenase (short-subunit alcohol dehydrogenase family)